MIRARALLQRVCDACRSILAEKLTGVYVHGSIAFGCFTWDTGDIDFLVVAEAPLTRQEKEALIRVLLDLSREAPPKGFEMSVMLRSACAAFQHPAPFELHFSNAHIDRARTDLSGYCRDMHGTDPDLAAHITVLRHGGERLCGPEIQDVFAAVPCVAYADSIIADIAGAVEDIGDNPVYVTLNLCRVLAYLQEGAVLSKRQGGEWGLRHLPAEYHPLLQAALDAYAGAAFPENMPLAVYAKRMLHSIHALI